MKSNERFLVTTTGSSYDRVDFTQTKIGSDTNRVQRRDPYYVKDTPITYYLHTALHSDAFDFPVSSVGNLDQIFSKGSSFSQATSKSHHYSKY